jgi:hypothetical protein
MSDVGFLVGRAVVEVQPLAAGGARIVFELGDKPVPAVYADVGPSIGRALRCEPQPEFEAWEVVGGEPQYLVVCTPGGELAVWDSTYIPSLAEAQETIDRLDEMTSWKGRVRKVTETGGIIVDVDSDDT